MTNVVGLRQFRNQPRSVASVARLGNGAAAHSPGRSTRWPPGATKTWQLNCTCVKEAAKACNRVTVTADGDLQGRRRKLAWKSTRPTHAAPPAAAAPAGKLTATIAEQADPIRVGGDTIYQIVVTNAGSTPQQQVVVSVKISEELRLIAIPTSPVAGTSFPRQVRFKPVAEIRPGESITFELQIQADSAGTGTVQVEVTGPVSPSRSRPKHRRRSWTDHRPRAAAAPCDERGVVRSPHGARMFG